ASGCSLVFMGNIDWDVNEGLEIDRTIPRFAKDPAFMDRIHGLIPGWRLPKITGEEHLAKGKGLALDYLGSVLHELRMMNFREEVKGLVDIVGNPSIRDQQAVIRLLSGFLKILYPDMNFDGLLLPKIVQIVEEMRGIIRKWLAAKLPHEYGEDFEVVLIG
ncbi:MAG TPA: ATP-dependent Lon-type protease, partial [Candidatus Korarchaeota archaeon]|nr:ATP-dependent Lon-type protease [Candidatus Korarchaeota archaeon]